MSDFNKEDTNPDIILQLEDLPNNEQSVERPMLDLSGIDLTKPIKGAEDRRTQPRLEMRGTIHLHASHVQNVVGIASDVSASGIGVRIDQRFQLQVGSAMTIEFRPPGELHGFMAQVEVVHATENLGGKRHLGLRIIKCTRLMEQKLIDFIKKAA
jgi:hypothetical protein